MSKLTKRAMEEGQGSTESHPTDFLLRCVKATVAIAREKHPQPYVDAHHFLGVLEEEIHELRAEVFKRRMNEERFQAECLQVAAVCVRAIEDVTFGKSRNAETLKR